MLDDISDLGVVVLEAETLCLKTRYIEEVFDILTKAVCLLLNDLQAFIHHVLIPTGVIPAQCTGVTLDQCDRRF